MPKNKAYFLSEYSDNTLEVSWEAIAHNINFFKKKLTSSTKVMLMVKAAAYGHYTGVICGKIESEKLADMFGVATFAEGMELRNEGIELPVMVQNVNPRYWNVMVEHCLEPVIHSFEVLHSFLSYLQSQESLLQSGYPIHVKLNTGMNRLGFDEKDIPQLVEELKNQTAIRVSSIMSHLSSSGNFAAEQFTLDQIQLFKSMSFRMKNGLKSNPLCHVLNTDGIHNYIESQMDMVRLGIGLYGASEADDLKKELRQVARFIGKVVAIRKVKKADYISYNRSGTVSEDSIIAVLSLGYADGVPRVLGNGNWEIEIAGKLYPTVGAICMDLCMVNLGKDKVKVGAEAIIFGGKKTVFDFAGAQGTITYEALTNVGNRAKRKLV